jgi:probable rRNA maturation factor
MVNILLEIEEGLERYSAVQAQVAAAVEKAVERTGGPDKAQVGLLIVGDGAIHELNMEHRGVDKATDVLSFPLIEPGEAITQADVDPETGEVVLGDIVISLPAAERQAAEYGNSLAREACFLAVHGTLHLLGYDHETDAERGEMRKLEEAVLESIGLARQENGK